MEYLIKVSALIVLLYLGYTIFLKKETFFSHNRWFLLLGLVAALILPLIVIPIYISVEPISISETPMNFIIDNSTGIVQETPFDWSQLLKLIYVIGVIICLTQFVLQFGSLLILLLNNTKNKDGIYTYVIVKNRISPFSFFKW
ncbi:MAG: M56 family peptidase, partial [Winogradskyella sp.]